MSFMNQELMQSQLLKSNGEGQKFKGIYRGQAYTIHHHSSHFEVNSLQPYQLTYRGIRFTKNIYDLSHLEQKKDVVKYRGVPYQKVTYVSG